MSKFSFAEHGQSFFSAEGVRSAVEAAASSPKVATVVAGSTVGMGAAAKLELLQSAIGMGSLIVGFMTGCIVMTIQLIKLIRVYRSWSPHKPEVKE